MKKLKQMTAAFVVAGALVSGCFILQVFTNTGEVYSDYNHNIHVEQGLDCSDCHEIKGNLASMPRIDTCLECHGDDPGEGYKAWMQSRRKSRKPMFGKKELPQYADVIFSHELHDKKKVECSACHGDVAISDVIRSSVKPPMDLCMSCHDGEKTRELNCGGCHKDIRRDRKPPSHRSGFLTSHGFSTDLDEMMDPKNKCSFCHSESGCSDCHQSTKPRDHNSYWPRRGHGLAASMERERCAVCHTEDYCISCHSTTMPRNHFSNWGEPHNRHCRYCHMSDPGYCAVCHDSFDHPSATPQHGRGANCALCHTMPHYDSGDACGVCHLPGGEEE